MRLHQLLSSLGVVLALSACKKEKPEEVPSALDVFPAIIMPPKSSEDVERFEREARQAKTASASLARTVIMPGRRYEQFKSFAEFRQFEEQGLRSLQRAEPILARHRFTLAVENHKDQRIPERLETLRKLSSEFIGVCFDMGNSFTLLEDPVETARAFAPWTRSVHIKDQAVRESEDGFWYADMALGDGCLDLPAMIQVLRAAQPAVRFGLETITRDPLSVPVLRADFWASLPEIPAPDLARTLRFINQHSSRKPFPLVSRLTPPRQMALELRTIERSARYARERLGMAGIVGWASF